jgi:hypothetical protein
MMILFFVYFGTHNHKIHTIIYKQPNVFVLVLLAKQQQQKIVNLFTISLLGFDLSIGFLKTLSWKKCGENVFLLSMNEVNIKY